MTIANDTGIYDFQSDASLKQFTGDVTHYSRCYQNKTTQTKMRLCA